MRTTVSLKTLKIFLLGVAVDYSHFFQPDWLETAHCSSVGWNHCLWACSKPIKFKMMLPSIKPHPLLDLSYLASVELLKTDFTA